MVTEEGEELGEITEIFPTGSNDVYVVKKDGKGKELLLPAIKDCIKNVDLENGVMTVKLLEGLRFMKPFFVLTLFPEIIQQTLSHSIMGSAQKE